MRTNINDTLYQPDDSLWNGTLRIMLSGTRSQPLYNEDGRTLTGLLKLYTVVDGVVDMDLEANETITPAGTSYNVEAFVGSAKLWQETWVVPVSTGPVSIADIRSPTVPNTGAYIAPRQLLLAEGNIIIGSDTGGVALAPGADDQILTMVAGEPAWAIPAIPGVATTALALATPRLIAGVAFDGTANIAIPSTGLSDSANLVRIDGSYANPAWITSLAGAKISGPVATASLAALATALATPRLINGVAFDGTVDITVTAAAGTLTGGTLAANVLASSITSFGSSPTIVTPTIASFANATHNHTNAAGGGTLTLAGAAFANQGTATQVLHGNAAGNPTWGAIVLTTDVSGVLPNANTTATALNTASAIVARDGSGNFAAGTITATLTGNAATAILASSATALATALPATRVMFGDGTGVPATSAAFTWDQSLYQISITAKDAGSIILKVRPEESGSLHYNFRSASFPNIVGSRLNQVFRQGWNIDGGGGRVDVADGAIADEWESHYAPGGTYFERHISYVTTANAVYRPMSWMINKATNQIDGAITSDDFSWYRRDTGAQWMKFQPGVVTFNSGSLILHGGNNGDVIKQLNFSGGSFVSLFRLNASDQFEMMPNGGAAKITGAFIVGGGISGNLTGNVTGTVTGNASTATALATPRAINGVDFDGTAAITVTAAAGTLTGATLAANVLASSLTSFGSSPTIVTPTIASFVNATHNHTNAAGGGTITLAGAAFANQGTSTQVLHGNAAGNPIWGAVVLTTDVSGVLPNANTTATALNTASAIIARDGSGNFAAGTITAALTGNAATATALSTTFSNQLMLFGQNTGIPATAAGFTYNSATFTLSVPFEIRLNGNSYTRVAREDGGGGFAGGYNLTVNSGAITYDSTGTASGFYYSATGVRFYAGSSLSAGSALTSAMTISSGGAVTIPGTLDVTGTLRAVAIGVGSAPPTSGIDVLSTVTGAALRVRATAARLPNITIGVSDVANADWKIRNTSGVLNFVGGDDLVRASFFTATGNFAIGLAPSDDTVAKLQVTGNVTLTNSGNSALTIKSTLSSALLRAVFDYGGSRRGFIDYDASLFGFDIKTDEITKMVISQAGVVTVRNATATTGNSKLSVEAGQGQSTNLAEWRGYHATAGSGTLLASVAPSGSISVPAGAIYNAKVGLGYNLVNEIFLTSDSLLRWMVGTSTSSSYVAGFALKSSGLIEVNTGTVIGTTPGNARDMMARVHYAVEATADPSAADLTIAGSNAQDVAAIYTKNNKLVIAYNLSGVVNYLTIPLDGLTIVMTQSVVAP